MFFVCQCLEASSSIKGSILHLACTGWQSNAITHCIPPKVIMKQQSPGHSLPAQNNMAIVTLGTGQERPSWVYNRESKVHRNKECVSANKESTIWKASPLQNAFNIHFNIIQALETAALPCSTLNKGTEKRERDRLPTLTVKFYLSVQSLLLLTSLT